MTSKTHDLHNGDCLDVLATLPAESVDVAIEDPPAGIAFMGRTWDNLARYEPRTEFGTSIRASLSVLGLAKWEVGFVVFMVEVHVAKLRVLKPGAIVASWALPKTSHLAALALRIAGYEVLDYVTHLFGQGMAKAGDLGKKIDKAAGAEREVVGMGAARCSYLERGEPCRCGERDGGEPSQSGGTVHTLASAPATPEAEAWTDWSTQLAPGCEFWILARKPTKLTTVQQVLTHGCGALNIGACRVPRGESDREKMCVPMANVSGSLHPGGAKGRTGDVFVPNPSGSWPKNVVLTEGGEDCPVSEIGGASRYFNRFRVAYYAKASDRSVPGSDDPKANRHETHKHPELMRWLVRLLARPDNVVLDCFMGSGTTGVACAAEGVSFIGIEREPKHFDVAQARIAYAFAAENPEHYSPKRAKTKRG